MFDYSSYLFMYVKNMKHMMCLLRKFGKHSKVPIMMILIMKCKDTNWSS